VDELRYSGCWEDDEDEYYGPKAQICTSEERELLFNEMQEFDPPKPDKWMMPFDARVTEPYFALLLIKASNLETLSFKNTGSDLPLFHAVTQLARENVNNGVETCLSKLTGLTVSNWNDDEGEEFGYSLDGYVDLLCLLSLRRFTGIRVNELEYESSPVIEKHNLTLGSFVPFS
jgi:hypothetical protein